jgi:hypothetical protein
VTYGDDPEKLAVALWETQERCDKQKALAVHPKFNIEEWMVQIRCRVFWVSKLNPP